MTHAQLTGCWHLRRAPRLRIMAHGLIRPSGQHGAGVQEILCRRRWKRSGVGWMASPSADASARSW